MLTDLDPRRHSWFTAIPDYTSLCALRWNPIFPVLGLDHCGNPRRDVTFPRGALAYPKDAPGRARYNLAHRHGESAEFKLIYRHEQPLWIASGISQKFHNHFRFILS
jgi:hypothetical protein